VLVAASAQADIDVCFANAGTTEMAIVDAMTRSGRIQPIPTLFEGVASGAADGYARIAGKAAAVLLHLGPGLANASANLHNARRARSPIVNWVGDHSTWMAPYDPPLNSDIESVAKGSSQWIHTCESAEQVGVDAVNAVRAAYGQKAGVATLILPADIMETQSPPGAYEQSSQVPKGHSRPVDAQTIETLAGVLKKAGSPLLLLGGPVLDARALHLGGRIAESVGGKVMVEQFPRCLRREPGLPAPERLAYLPFQARRQLAVHDVVVAVGTEAPVCFFGYEGQAPRLTAEGSRVFEPDGEGCCGHQFLSALAEALDAPSNPQEVARSRGSADVAGALHPGTVCRVLAEQLPEEAIVVCEGITSALPLYGSLEGAASHDLLTCKGGAIGFGTPAATGAAVAAPDRRVVTYVGDGSASYTLQALWTQARMGLNVTTIVLANQKYAVLQLELMRLGAKVEGAGRALTDIGNPSLDFSLLARGFGVPGRRVETLDEFAAALETSFATPGPFLIEVLIA
jgi:acetolactate synthase-1/2/3 large subunit